MKLLRKKWITGIAFSLLCASVSATSSHAYAQASPTAIGPFWTRPLAHLPNVEGGFQYSLSLSQTVGHGANYGGSSSTGTFGYTNVSGTASYFTEHPTRPLSVTYSGAYIAGDGGQQNSYVTQSLALSQAFHLKNTNIHFADTISYLPQTSSPGLLGIPSAGDPNLGTSAGNVTLPVTQGILSSNATQVSNAVSTDVSQRLAGRLYLTGNGSYALQRFTSPNGLDGSQIAAGGGPNYRIDQRTNAGASYNYSHIAYANLSRSIDVYGINGTYSRNVSRKLTFDVSVGPQWTSANLGSKTRSLNVAANTGFTYAARSVTGVVRYTRGANNGFGVVQGSRSDSLTVQATHLFSRAWFGSVSAGYTHSTSLAGVNTLPFSANTMVGGVQGTRHLSRVLSAFLSYSAIQQSSSGSFSTFGYQGLSHLVALGVTFSPGAWTSNRQ